MNRAILVGALVLAALVPWACRRTALTDTPEARAHEARAYLRIFDLRTLVENAASQSAASLSIERRGKLPDFVRSETRWTELENSVVNALVKNFTAGEIHALATFQGSPEGKSILGNLPQYQAEVIPILQEEVQRVLAASDFAASALRWDTVARDLTAGPADETVPAVFSFRNSGTKTVNLLTITTSCGCITAKPEKTSFNPGERGSISTLFIKGNRTGLQDQQIVVTTDEPEHPALALRLRVQVEDPLKISPRFLFWSSGSAADPQTVSVEIPASAGLDFLGFDEVSSGFTAKMEPARDGSSRRVQIAPRTTLRPSLGKILFQAAAGGGRVIRIPVFLRVLPPRAPGEREAGRGQDILWIEAEPSIDDESPLLPGAFPLSEDSWDAQIEPILARWTPEVRLVILGQPVGAAAHFAERLKAYGLSHIYGLIPIQ